MIDRLIDWLIDWLIKLYFSMVKILAQRPTHISAVATEEEVSNLVFYAQSHIAVISGRRRRTRRTRRTTRNQPTSIMFRTYCKSQKCFYPPTLRFPCPRLRSTSKYSYTLGTLYELCLRLPTLERFNTIRHPRLWRGVFLKSPAKVSGPKSPSWIDLPYGLWRDQTILQPAGIPCTVIICWNPSPSCGAEKSICQRDAVEKLGGDMWHCT